MNWEHYIFFAIVTMVLLILGSSLLCFAPRYKKLGNILFVSAIIVIGTFIALMWANLQRPPMRTMGETRLWYGLFLSGISYFIYRRWSYQWIPVYGALMASMFLLLNLLKPEVQSKNLMPALQSVWFVPHVSVYMMSYAMLGAATLMAIYALYKKSYSEQFMQQTDNLVYIGSGLLMLGLLMGALWAKEVWCHFWSWDPKETWAFITFAAYMVYVHFRKYRPSKKLFALYLLVFAFICLMITWKGVSYLPSAKASMHSYSNS
ncbi:MAG: cytochrome c biogenesis protein CcsA [Mangrovibacterium sp.]